MSSVAQSQSLLQEARVASKLLVFTHASAFSAWSFCDNKVRMTGPLDKAKTAHACAKTRNFEPP